MHSVREKWTDERLDDINERVSDGFERVDRDIRDLRGEMTSRFDSLEARTDARFDAINDRFDAMHKLLLRAAGAALGIFVTTGVALVATQL